MVNAPAKQASKPAAGKAPDAPKAPTPLTPEEIKAAADKEAAEKEAAKAAKAAAKVERFKKLGALRVVPPRPTASSST